MKDAEKYCGLTLRGIPTSRFGIIESIFSHRGGELWLKRRQEDGSYIAEGVIGRSYLEEVTGLMREKDVYYSLIPDEGNENLDYIV